MHSPNWTMHIFGVFDLQEDQHRLGFSFSVSGNELVVVELQYFM